MQRERNLAGLGLADQLVEGIEHAVVRRDDPDLAAPDQERVDGVEHAAHVLVERRLVDAHHALQAADVLGPRRQRLDPAARGEADAEGRDQVRAAVGLLVLEHEFLDPAEVARDDTCEMRAIADELAALVLGVADVEAVLAAGRFLGRGDQRLVERLGEGDAGAPSFFAEFEIALVLDPFGLVAHEYAVGERIEIFGHFRAARQFLWQSARIA